MTRPSARHPDFYARYAAAYAAELSAFVDCLRRKAPFDLGPDLGWKTLLVANLAEASSRSGGRRFDLVQANGSAIATVVDAVAVCRRGFVAGLRHGVDDERDDGRGCLSPFQRQTLMRATASCSSPSRGSFGPAPPPRRRVRMRRLSPATSHCRSPPCATSLRLARGPAGGSVGERCAETRGAEFRRLGLLPPANGTTSQSLPLASALNPHAPGGTGCNVLRWMPGSDPILAHEWVVMVRTTIIWGKAAPRIRWRRAIARFTTAPTTTLQASCPCFRGGRIDAGPRPSQACFRSGRGVRPPGPKNFWRSRRPGRRGSA